MKSAWEEKLDQIVSIYIRMLANWKCIVCRRRYVPVIGRDRLPGQNMLTTSHFFNRWKRSVRWDIRNLDSICIFCHEAVEHKKKGMVNGFVYEKYMIEKLGQEEFDKLKQLANKIVIFNVEELKTMYNDFRSKVKAKL